MCSSDLPGFRARLLDHRGRWRSGARGAVAFGPVLQRAGDYYGPVVNLASRVAELAVPYEILVTEELVHAAEHWSLAFKPAGRRMLKGFEEPVSLWELQRDD